MKRLLPVIFLFSTLLAGAQITSPGRSALTYTNYLSTVENDPVFIYCATGGNTPGLQAVSPGGTAPFTFDWYGYDFNSSGFDIPLHTDISVVTSSITNLSDGGYQVHITDGGGYDTSLVAWIFVDSPYAEIGLQKQDCYYIFLRGKAEIDTFYYYDIINGQQLVLPNDVSYLWSSDPVSNIPFPETHHISLGEYMIKKIGTPPLEDVWYKLEVTDNYGCVSESSFFYESIHVKAEFEIDPDRGEAPLEVTFTNNSVRALNYIWDFGDDTISTLPDPGIHTYYYPGEYTVRLIIESDKLCIDSVRFDKIIVEPSSLDIPNVFTPDGDGANDYFYVESKSLRNLSVQIFSRSGKRVYLYNGKGDSLRDWLGWDGKIGSSYVSPGVYFYIIRARGWDDIFYDGEEYRGFVYLYR
ncbi:MAG: gliding motility-associated C-terminal domain-containing protein [Bacteroidales bacterium]|nr:gliding motility-associated C-terminal domain-containing protein [Bacteroidales bacterium]